MKRIELTTQHALLAIPRVAPVRVVLNKGQALTSARDQYETLICS